MNRKHDEEEDEFDDMEDEASNTSEIEMEIYEKIVALTCNHAWLFSMRSAISLSFCTK